MTRTISEVVEHERRWIMSLPGVEGVGIGASSSENKEPCIFVYLSSETRPAELPDRLEGYRVEVQRSGAFRAR